MTSNNLKDLDQRVFDILKNYKEARDNKLLTIKLIWEQDLISMGFNLDLFALSFLSLLERGLLSNPESITRAWRKMLADNLELRGPGYLKRKKLEQDYRDLYR